MNYSRRGTDGLAEAEGFILYSPETFPMLKPREGRSAAAKRCDLVSRIRSRERKIIRRPYEKLMRSARLYSYTLILSGMTAWSRRLRVCNAGWTMMGGQAFGMRLFRIVLPIVLRAIVISRRGILEVGGQRECKDCQSLGRHLDLLYVGTWVEVVGR